MISMAPVGVNDSTFLSPTSSVDPGGLSQAAQLDVDGDGDLDPADLTILRRRATTSTGDDAWRAAQAAMLLATGRAADRDATVRGSLGWRPGSGASGPRDAIDAIRSLDTSGLARAGVPLVAAFDYDDTLARGDVFLPAMRALAAAGAFDATGAPSLRKALVAAGMATDAAARLDANAAADLVARATGSSSLPGIRSISVADSFYAFGDGLRGMDVQRARSVVADAFERGVPSIGVAPLRSAVFDASPATGDGMGDVVAATRAAGMTPWIVSWGFEFIARIAAPYVGIEPANVVGSGMVEREGRFEGLAESSARPKWELLRDRVGTPPVAAFGNSGSDLPMLDATAGPSFLVDPSSTAMATALAERAGRTAPIWFRHDR